MNLGDDVRQIARLKHVQAATAILGFVLHIAARLEPARRVTVGIFFHAQCKDFIEKVADALAKLGSGQAREVQLRAGYIVCLALLFAGHVDVAPMQIT